MNEVYPLVPLNQLLTRKKEEINIQELNTYTRITIKMNGQGITIRDCVLGSEIGTKKQFIARYGQLILSKIDARNGAFGILPNDCDGAIVTGNFWAFEVDHKLLDIKYFDYLTKTPLFIDFCVRASDGTTNRLYLQESKFLSMEIPLPPLEEQRRIVARVEELVGKIEEVRSLRQKALEETMLIYKSAVASLIQPNTNKWETEKVSDVILSIDAGWSPQCEDISASKNEWGVLKTTAVQWSEFCPYENKKLPKSLIPKPHLSVQKGDVLVTRAGPRKRVGVIATVRESEPYLMISDKLIRLRLDQTKIEPRFLEQSLASPLSQEHLVKRKTGLADAQVNISQAILLSTPITYPPLSEQRRIVAYLDELQTKIDTMKQLREEAIKELDALLPSILDKAFKGEL